MKNTNPPCVLTIAGTDPSGGAGIQADIKTISANQCYAASVITALVAQNTVGVKAIRQVSADFLMQQLQAVFDDLEISAVKIGMLHNETVIETIASAIELFRPQHIVLDPVMVAKNGCALLDLDVIDFLKRRLFPLVELITPNLFEAGKILNHQIENQNEMAMAAQEIGRTYKVNVLVKGGHLDDEQSADVLYAIEDGRHHWFHAERIATKNTHGTGCTLSSAIASQLARGLTLPAAILKAKDYLSKAIRSGSTMQIGKGCGPVNHFYIFDETM